MVCRSLATLFLSLLVVQTTLAVPTGGKQSKNIEGGKKAEKAGNGQAGLTYVEVGARNTEVGHALRSVWPVTTTVSHYGFRSIRTGGSGWKRMDVPLHSGTTFLSIRTSRTSRSSTLSSRFLGGRTARSRSHGMSLSVIILSNRILDSFHPADHLTYVGNRHQTLSSMIPVKARPDSSRTSGRMSPTPFSTARSRKPGRVPTLNIPLLDSKGITIRSTCSISGRSEWGTRFQGREATALIDNRRV